MKIINLEHLKKIKQHMSPENCLRVFDFDETLTTKWWSSFSPIHDADVSWELDILNDWMICIYVSSSYEQMHDQLKKKWLTLPSAVIKKIQEQDYDIFKHEQMSYRRIETMEVWIKTNTQINFCDHEKFTARTWSINLIDQLLKLWYDVLIISAWVTNVIKYVFEKWWIDLTHKHLTIVANEFKTDSEWVAVWYSEPLVTCYTKCDVDYQSYGIPEKKYALQFWDSYTDSMMVINYFDRGNLLNIWFTNWNDVKKESFKDAFDILIDDKVWGMDEICELFQF